MKFSLSSLFITLAISCFLIYLLNVVLTKKKLYSFFCIDFLCLLVLIVVLRLCLPVELFFTKSIRSMYFMTGLRNFFFLEVDGYPLYTIFFCIWGAGCAVSLIRYIKKLWVIENLYKKIVKNAECFALNDLFEKPVNDEVDVFVSSKISSPMVLGFHKNILLPDVEFSKEELDNILQHELQHIRNHDILIKQIINVLSIIYWGFPPMKRLSKNMQLFLEIRVDSKVVEFSDKEKLFSYAYTLVHVQKRLAGRSAHELENNGTFLINDQISVLEYRINYLLKGNVRKKTKALVRAFLIALPILSYSVILEPYYVHSQDVDGCWTEKQVAEEAVLIHHKDDTYSVLINGENATIQNPDRLIDQGITVKEE